MGASIICTYLHLAVIALKKLVRILLQRLVVSLMATVVIFLSLAKLGGLRTRETITLMCQAFICGWMCISGTIGPTDCFAYSIRDLATNKPLFAARSSAYPDCQSAIQPCLNFSSFSTNQHMPTFDSAASPTSYPPQLDDKWSFFS
ncbi:hypothetical protein LOK49_LG05G03966 [Camellia lanceoleosa]|uniref:Uncharacterized protein n=1 Tax=Camellia lanceoleosa TaxID=1840588 RepID=A0ACC0HSB8_9ERIC|nr:hypothetical protein LOK49_LG05G03966 [Camellia lanceoleosa]